MGSPRAWRPSRCGRTLPPGSVACGCLVFERGDELLGETETWIARQHLGTQVGRNSLGVATRDVHSRRAFEQMAFGVGRNVDYIPHVPHNDLSCATAALQGPPGCGAEDPRHVTASFLERQGVIIELLHEREIVEHSRDVE
jgi:hypothetical protein